MPLTNLCRSLLAEFESCLGDLMYGSLSDGERSSKLFCGIVLHIKAACNITTGPVASCECIRQKTAMGQAEQDPDLPCSASYVLGKVQYHLCLTEWRGRRKCRQGKSTLGAACPAKKIMFCNLSCTLKRDHGVTSSHASTPLKIHFGF